MDLAHEDDGACRADGGVEHVGLGIPDISLRAEECIGRLAGAHRDAPLKEFVKHADGGAQRHDNDGEPAAPLHHLKPHQQFAGDERRDETLEEVADLIVVVARLAEGVADPVEQRHLGVGVVAADEENPAVH